MDSNHRPIAYKASALKTPELRGLLKGGCSGFSTSYPCRIKKLSVPNARWLLPMGIEPMSTAWKAVILPLYESSIVGVGCVPLSWCIGDERGTSLAGFEPATYCLEGSHASKLRHSDLLGITPFLHFAMWEGCTSDGT